MGIEVKKRLVSADKYALKCPNPMTPEYITIHNTANDASAANEISYMTGNSESTSYHFAVDDKEVIQGIPLTGMPGIRETARTVPETESRLL